MRLDGMDGYTILPNGGTPVSTRSANLSMGPSAEITTAFSRVEMPVVGLVTITVTVRPTYEASSEEPLSRFASMFCSSIQIGWLEDTSVKNAVCGDSWGEISGKTT